MPTSSSTSIVGVGIDLVEFGEFTTSVADRPRNLARVFTPAELAACTGPRRIEKLAARFAAKEAAMKAAGTGWTGNVKWRDAEVVASRGRAPTLVVRGALRKAAAKLGGATWHLSFSHSGTYATAIVILTP